MGSATRLAEGECTTIAQTLDLSTDVTIVPVVKCGPIRLTCRAGTVILSKDPRPSTPPPSEDQCCHFTVFQSVLVEIPLTYAAQVTTTLREVQSELPSTTPGGFEP